MGTEPLSSAARDGGSAASSWWLTAAGRRRLLAAALVAAAGAVVAGFGRPAPALSGTGLAVSAALAGLVIGVLAAALAIGRSPRRQAVATALVLAGGMALLRLQPGGASGLFGAGVALALAGAGLRRRPLLFAVLAGAVFILLAATGSWHRGLAASAAQSFPLLVISAVVLLIGRLRDAKEQAETLLLQVEENRSAETRAAALAERQRLAREVHDVLAHSLSGLMLQLEGARMLAASSPSDARLPEAVDRAHQLAKDGLNEARRAISMLRGGELPGPAALETLTGQFEQHSGIPCALRVTGQPRRLRPDASLALYRVTQEALTNVVRHADAQRVEVCLAYAPGQVLLTVEDFGAGAAPAGPVNGESVGYGLTGMRERAELLGGTLTASPTTAGFRVELRVPAGVAA